MMDGFDLFSTTPLGSSRVGFLSEGVAPGLLYSPPARFLAGAEVSGRCSEAGSSLRSSHARGFQLAPSERAAEQAWKGGQRRDGQNVHVAPKPAKPLFGENDPSSKILLTSDS